MQKILEYAALWQADGDLPLSAVVAAQARHLPRGSTAVLVTPSPEMDIALAAESLRSRGQQAVVVLLDGVTFGGAGDCEALWQRLYAMQVPAHRVREGSWVVG